MVHIKQEITRLEYEHMMLTKTLQMNLQDIHGI